MFNKCHAELSEYLMQTISGRSPVNLKTIAIAKVCNSRKEHTIFVRIGLQRLQGEKNPSELKKNLKFNLLRKNFWVFFVGMT